MNGGRGAAIVITSEIAFRNFSPLLPILFPFGGFTMVLLARQGFQNLFVALKNRLFTVGNNDDPYFILFCKIWRQFLLPCHTLRKFRFSEWMILCRGSVRNEDWKGFFRPDKRDKGASEIVCFTVSFKLI